MAVVRLIRRRHLFRLWPTPMTSGGGAVETGQTGRPGRSPCQVTRLTDGPVNTRLPRARHHHHRRRIKHA